MKVTTVMFYKEHHTSISYEVRFYESIELAEAAADAMIDHFRFWGGGSVPLEIVQTKWTKHGSKTLYHNTIDPQQWEPYSRECGNKYGYFSCKKQIA